MNDLQIQQSVDGITLITVSRAIEIAPLIDLFRDPRTIYVCDAYVQDIERMGEPITGGFRFAEQLINIDHRAPVALMQQRISSAPLAIERVRAEGTAASDDVVVINHIDADSILSAAVIRGIIPADERFGIAAIAADHTGEENDLADLLQACGQHRSLGLSLRTLHRFLDGRALEPQAQPRLIAIVANATRRGSSWIKAGSNVPKTGYSGFTWRKKSMEFSFRRCCQKPKSSFKPTPCSAATPCVPACD